METFLWHTWMVMHVVAFVATHLPFLWQLVQSLRQYVADGGNFADTDYYKFTMGQFIWLYFPKVWVTYTLTVRGKSNFPPGFDRELRKRLSAFADKNHSLDAQTHSFLSGIHYFRQEYLDYLADQTQPKLHFGALTITQYGNELRVRVSDLWKNGHWWELPLMSTTSALFYEMTGQHEKGLEWMFRAVGKGRTLKKAGAPFADMGARRRKDFWVQVKVLILMMATGSVKRTQDRGGLLGTSNVFLARLLNISAIGTMAHELFMVVGALYGYNKANQIVITLWKQLYGNALGYYLPDTYGTDEFNRHFSREDVMYFTGPRQDSGDPCEFVDKTIAFYRRIGLSQKEIAQKTIIFSDSLDVPRALEILRYARNAGIRAAFGIGTNFTNDVGLESLKIVVKPYEVWLEGSEENKRGCAKISDDPAKVTGHSEVAKQLLAWQETGEKAWDASDPLMVEYPVLPAPLWKE